MLDIATIFGKLEAIYANCKPMPLMSSRYSCTTPHLTFAEFLYLLKGMKDCNNPETTAKIALTRPEYSTQAPNETECPLQIRGGCGALAQRCMVCRVSGLPESAQPGMHGNPLLTESAREEILNPIREQLGFLNAGIHAFEAEPYFLDALTLHCWFAIALDPDITQPFFLNLRKIALSVYDISFLTPQYVNTTLFKEKINAIDLFFQLNEQQMAVEAYECLKLIHDGFPATGGYYRPQALIFARFLQDILNQSAVAAVC